MTTLTCPNPNNKIHEIIDFAMLYKLNIDIRKHTIKVSGTDGWSTISVEAYHHGEASELRFMWFVPFCEMKEEIIKKFELQI